MAVQFKANRRGIAQLLRLPKVESDLEARAQRVARSATIGDAEYNVHAETGRVRARAAVVTGNFEAAVVEHRQHRLARAIHAAR